jgi:hypothetical protein
MNTEEAKAFVAERRHTVTRNTIFVQLPYYFDIICGSPTLRAVLGGFAVGQMIAMVIDFVRP